MRLFDRNKNIIECGGRHCYGCILLDPDTISSDSDVPFFCTFVVKAHTAGVLL